MFGDKAISELRLRVLELKDALAVARKERAGYEALIESDLKRVEAVAKLNTYIDMDTKDDRKHISKMLEMAIGKLGNTSVQIVK